MSPSGAASCSLDAISTVSRGPTIAIIHRPDCAGQNRSGVDADAHPEPISDSPGLIAIAQGVRIAIAYSSRDASPFGRGRQTEQRGKRAADHMVDRSAVTRYQIGDQADESLVSWLICSVVTSIGMPVQRRHRPRT